MCRIQGVQNWTNKDKWYGPGNVQMPQITMTSTVLPMFLMFLKIVQVSIWMIMKACNKKAANSSDKGGSIKKSVDSESGGTPSQDEEVPNLKLDE